MIEDLTASDPPIDLSSAAGLVSDYATGRLNEQQRRTLEEVENRLSGLRMT